MAVRSIALSPTDVARFWSYVKRDDRTGCLIWVGATSSTGYGVFDFHGASLGAHRVAWIIANNEDVPQDKPHVLHNCPYGDNRTCCEPSHLWVGTSAENQLDKAMKGRGRVSRNGLPVGVRYGRGGKFRGAVRLLNGYLNVGSSFLTVEDAAAAVNRVRNEIFEEFQRQRAHRPPP